METSKCTNDKSQSTYTENNSLVLSSSSHCILFLTEAFSWVYKKASFLVNNSGPFQSSDNSDQSSITFTHPITHLEFHSLEHAGKIVLRPRNNQSPTGLMLTNWQSSENVPAISCISKTGNSFWWINNAP